MDDITLVTTGDLPTGALKIGCDENKALKTLQFIYN